jgi:CRP-like cAMP-binding protein
MHKLEMEATPLPTGPDNLEALLTTAFPNARDDVRSVLLETVELRQIEAGLPVTDQGDLADVLLVTFGHVGLRRGTSDGRQIMPRIMTTGELVTMSRGERAPPAGSIALTSCEVAAWKPADVYALAAHDAGFALDLIGHVLDSFETVVTGLDGLLHQDAALRVARVLHHHQTLFFGEPPILSRAHLPAMVGTSREMTRRVFRVLEARAIVARTPGGGLILRDPGALEATAAAR